MKQSTISGLNSLVNIKNIFNNYYMHSTEKMKYYHCICVSFNTFLY